MNITVNVTQQHINNGCQCDNGFCPIALAIKEIVIPSLQDYVEVYNSYVLIGFNNIERVDLKTDLPPLAIKFIRYFDQDGKDSQPFNFSLNIPNKYKKYFKSIT